MADHTVPEIKVLSGRQAISQAAYEAYPNNAEVLTYLTGQLIQDFLNAGGVISKPVTVEIKLNTDGINKNLVTVYLHGYGYPGKNDGSVRQEDPGAVSR